MLPSPEKASKLVISPPGKGIWHIIDHITRPGSRLFSEYYYKPMQNGWNEEARRIGLIVRIQIREAGGFMYYQFHIASAREIVRAESQIQRYWKTKRFLSELQTWDQKIKQQSVRELSQFQGAQLSKFSDQELSTYLKKCFQATKRNVKRHHQYTYTSFIPLGDFINQVHCWCQVQPSEILHSIEDRKTAILPVVSDQFLDALVKDIGVLCLLATADDHPDQAKQIYTELSPRKDVIGAGVRTLEREWGSRIIDGYDVTSETYGERPDLLLKSLKSLVDRHLQGKSSRDNSLIKYIPDERVPLFEELLHDVSMMKRLRNERGFYTDLWAIGLLRHAVLEVGKRLVEKGMISEPILALESSFLELIQFLENSKPVTSKELQARACYSREHTVDDAPSTLGEMNKEASVTKITLSPDMERTMSGLKLAIELAVTHQPSPALPSAKKGTGTLKGIPASKGRVEGWARVINSADQLKEIQRGDILVVYQSTAAFNAVFPLIGGIISQYGGTLSHPAILAREHGIPCIVGCAEAMSSLKTGMRIRIDGTEGIVKIIEDQSDLRLQLEALQCSYVGPMQGRNRDRVLNHIAAIQNRLTLMHWLRQESFALNILENHFHQTISTEEALESIAPLWKDWAPGHDDLSEVIFEWMQRLHVEFHPCDACNLQCDGCTYSQDHLLKPKFSSFPFDHVSTMLATLKPKAITIVGGGEPALYQSQGRSLGDLITVLGEGTFGIRPSIGLITNGTIWPQGNPHWPLYTKWIRFSLDASDAETFMRFKGKKLFDQVFRNVFRALTETSISQVGVGYVYHPGNIAKASQLISLLAKYIQENCPEYLHRFNIQFRPWRPPTGEPSISNPVISKNDSATAAAEILTLVQSDAFLEQFVRQNTNIAVNLLCNGARERVGPFSECFVGLAKSVVRADGRIYPCFRMAAQRKPEFLAGSIVYDSLETIALRSLYIQARVAPQICSPKFDKCLFCVFNNIVESNLYRSPTLDPEIVGDYFF